MKGSGMASLPQVHEQASSRMRIRLDYVIGDT
jgi:hypothetical protein